LAPILVDVAANEEVWAKFIHETAKAETPHGFPAVDGIAGTPRWLMR
jgi:hypothetical protein